MATVYLAAPFAHLANYCGNPNFGSFSAPSTAGWSLGLGALTALGVGSVTTTAAAAAAIGATTLSVASVTGIAIGDFILDSTATAAITPGTTITAITGTVLTLSAALVGAIQIGDGIAACNVPIGAPASSVGEMTAAAAFYGAFAVTPGQTFFVSASIAGTGSPCGAGLWLQDASGGNGTWLTPTLLAPTATWQQVSGVLTIPATIANGATPAHAQVGIQNTTSGTAPFAPVYFTQILVQPPAAPSALASPVTVTQGQRTAGPTLEIDNLPPGAYQIAVKSVGVDGRLSAPATYLYTTTLGYQTTQVPVSGQGPTPADPSGFTGTGQVRSALLQWVASKARDVGGYYVFRGNSASNGPTDPINPAAQIATVSRGDSFIDAQANVLIAGSSWRYWIQVFTTTGVVSPNYIGPANVTIGTALLQGTDIASLATTQLVGTLGMEQLAAGSVGPLQLIATDFTNLCSNPLFSDQTGTPQVFGWSSQQGAGCTVLAVAATAAGVPAGAPAKTVGVLNSYQSSFGYPFPVIPGQTFAVSIAVAVPAGWAGYTVGAALWVSDAAATSSTMVPCTPIAPTATWAVVSGQITIPATVGGNPSALAQLQIVINGPTATPYSPPLYVTQVICRKAADPSLLVPQSVTATVIASQTITATEIANNTITANQIAGNSITANQIAANTITAGQIANNTITSNQIASQTITANQIASNSITGNQIAGNSITGTNIAGSTITGTNIAGGTITGNNIGAQTITGNNISANTITGDKIVLGTNSSPIWNSCPNFAMTGWQLATGTLNGTAAPQMLAVGTTNQPTWELNGFGNGELVTASAQAAGAYLDALWNPNGDQKVMPVTPGQNVLAQASVLPLIGVGYLYILWADINGNFLNASFTASGQVSASVDASGNSLVPNGNDLGFYTTLWVTAVAPANAAYATLVVRSYSTGTLADGSSVNRLALFWSRAMLLNVGAVVPTAPYNYQPGGLTAIYNGELVTGQSIAQSMTVLNTANIMDAVIGTVHVLTDAITSFATAAYTGAQINGNNSWNTVATVTYLFPDNRSVVILASITETFAQLDDALFGLQIFRTVNATGVQTTIFSRQYAISADQIAVSVADQVGPGSVTYTLQWYGASGTYNSSPDIAMLEAELTVLGRIK